MLGLFITGPGGLVLGLIAGFVLAVLNVSPAFERGMLISIASLVALGTLYASTPPPEFMGRIVDAEPAACMAPADALPGAVSEWQKSIDQLPRAQPRAGWREDAERVAKADTGAVITMRIRRDVLVYEQRKPWNYGKLVLQPWRNSAQNYSYYMRTAAGCTNFAKLKRDVYFPVTERESGAGWPPVTLPNILRMQVLGPVPDKYQDLLD